MSEMHTTNKSVNEEPKIRFWQDPEKRKAIKEAAIETGVTIAVGVGIQVVVALTSQAIVKQINLRFENQAVVDVTPEIVPEAEV